MTERKTFFKHMFSYFDMATSIENFSNNSGLQPKKV